MREGTRERCQKRESGSRRCAGLLFGKWVKQHGCTSFFIAWESREHRFPDPLCWVIGVGDETKQRTRRPVPEHHWRADRFIEADREAGADDSTNLWNNGTNKLAKKPRSFEATAKDFLFGGRFLWFKLLGVLRLFFCFYNQHHWSAHFVLHTRNCHHRFRRHRFNDSLDLEPIRQQAV